MLEIEMVCGVCDGYYRVASGTDDWNDTLVLFAHRFANAHSECRFMVPVNSDGDLLDFDAPDEDDDETFHMDPILDAPPMEIKVEDEPAPAEDGPSEP